MKVAAYYRVSTAGQAGEDRFGLAAQRAAVLAYCRSHRHEIVATYEDAGYSGASADRAALATMLKDAGHANAEGRKPPFDAVVVAKGDRLARDVMLDGYLRFTLKKFGVEVVSSSEETAGNDPMARLMQTILAGFAQFERSLITARLVDGRRLKKAEGGYSEGRPRYGMRAENRALVIDDKEAHLVSRMRTLRKKGLTIRAIAVQLNSEGHQARHGSPWRASSVHNVLKRLTKPGLRKSGGTPPRETRKRTSRGTG